MKSNKMKNDCYNCKYRNGTGISGSTQSQCESPLISSVSNSISVIANHSGVSGINSVISKFGIQSITNNLEEFMFPVDFNPTWVSGECNQHGSLSKEASILMMSENSKFDVSDIGEDVIEKLKMEIERNTIDLKIYLMYSKHRQI